MNKNKLTAVFLAAALIAAALLPVSAALDGSERGPVAVDASYKTYPGVSVNGVLQASESGEFVFTVEKTPKKGELYVENGSFEYTPKDNKTGKDRFTFTVTDEKGRKSLPATVEIEICKRSSKDVFYYSDMTRHPAHYASLFLRQNGIMSGETFGKESFF